ncbi:GSCFA domain-containing protein [Carboxylicivirga sp. A043]|uniref:GSCFA domain-containing protein n=1 Tax=Carboxylicivirga litoralis TaxID=2816963 RepID=UPI0021CB42E4|nr:GSCFA domain-containing protein [Carboxylicivirga sp. A043]MCU4157912.1 GSCFA domain-containing protein [Carboxylicivirga sp. A043]
MDSFRTEVKVPISDKLIKYDDKLLFIGSCFATNIGDYFKANCLNAMVNPFGVLYNPFSIANSLERLLGGQSFTSVDVLEKDKVFHSFYHHSQFNANDEQAFLNSVNSSFTKSAAFLNTVDTFIITFGTAWVYEHNESGMIVSNCHKYPAADFRRFRLSVDDIVHRYQKLIKQIKALNPKVRFQLTVSPVRHWKDGAHGNQLSKSTLLLAIDKLVEEFDCVDYFPAYELLLDELRDYRFFADDMLHPSKKAVEFIRAKFITSQFDEMGKKVLQKLEKLNQAAKHRPFNLESDAHQAFVKNNLAKLVQMQQQYPTLDLSVIRLMFEKQLI